MRREYDDDDLGDIDDVVVIISRVATVDHSQSHEPTPNGLVQTVDGRVSHSNASRDIICSPKVRFPDSR